MLCYYYILIPIGFNIFRIRTTISSSNVESNANAIAI